MADLFETYDSHGITLNNTSWYNNPKVFNPVTDYISPTAITDGAIGGTMTSGNFKTSSLGWSISDNGDVEFNNGNFRGTITATTGSIGGWLIAATTLSSTGMTFDSTNKKILVGSSGEIVIDGANKEIESSNYVAGVFGSGFHLDSNLLEVGNVALRGKIRTALFQKDVISTVGGNLTVLDGDVLDANMTSDETELLTTTGNTSFAIGDIIRIKDGIDDEWMKILSDPGVLTLEDSYSETNQSSWYSLKVGTTLAYVSQSFTNATANRLNKVRLYLRSLAGPTSATMTVKIYAHAGVYGTSSVPTGAPLAISDSVSCLGLTSSFVLTDFTFDGAERVELAASTNYCLVLTTDSVTNLAVQIGIDDTSPTATGNAGYSTDGSAWTAEPAVDLCFYVYGNLITTTATSPYNVIRDMALTYTSHTNPAWKKGATIVNYKQSGDGGIYMTASDGGAPNLSIFDHSGSPWTSVETRLRIGNLNGYLGYNTKTYGIAIGETNKYLKYDSVNGLRIKGDKAELDVGVSGYLKGGQTDYETGTGFFLGYSATDYKFSLGSTTNFLKWDGAHMKLKGALEVGSNGMINNSSYTVALLPTPATATGFNNPSGIDSNSTVIADSYSESHSNASQGIASGGFGNGIGQSFTITNASVLDKCKFYISKTGSPVGNAYAKIYAHAGNYGVSSHIPSFGTPLATSDALDISTLTGSKVLTTFNFTGANRIDLTANTYYIITIESTDCDNSNFVSVGVDTVGSASGNETYLAVGSSTLWNSLPHDVCFYVYTLLADFTNPTNAYASDDTYATLPAITGDLTISLSKDSGATYNTVLTQTFAAGESVKTYGLGSSELWGTSWLGSDITDTNLRLKIFNGTSSQIYKNFGFAITGSLILTGLEITAEAKFGSGTISLDNIQIKVYSGSTTIPVIAGSQAFASNGRKAGEGAGAGTGVLVFYDSTNWIACDTGATVAA